MRKSRLCPIELALSCAALLGLGCGLIDNDVEQRSPASWCDEAAAAEVAAVEIYWNEVDGSLRQESVKLLDDRDRWLATISLTEDGAIEWRRDYLRDAEGRVTREEWDDEGDGTVEAVSIRTHDDEGRLVLTSYDQDNDGTVDATQSSSYSPDERRHVVDQDNDGTPEFVYVGTYSEEGHLVREEYDDDGDGEVDRTSTYAYSDSGLLIEMIEERSESTTVTTLAYDEDDRLLQVIRVSDGLIEGLSSEENYEYDGDLLTAIATDHLRDGDIDWTEHRTYDTEGRLVRVELRDSDGELHYAREYEYSGETEVRRSFDDDGDGDWDSELVRIACD